MKNLFERLEDRVLLSRTLVDGPVLNVWADPHDTIAVVRAAVVAGDTNLNGQIDINDYLTMDRSMLTGAVSPGWAGGDLNGDGVVNGADFALIAGGGTVTGWEVVTNGVGAFFASPSIVHVSVVAVGVDGVALSGTVANVSFWADTSTAVNAGPGTLHRISSFYQPWTSDSGSADYVPLALAGQDLRDPLDTLKVRYNAPLWGNSPSMADVAQGNVSDCYWLAGLNALMENTPHVLFDRIVNLGDGTFGVHFTHGTAEDMVRVDGDFSSGQVQFRGATWDLVAEKAYAFVRSGLNSYVSLNIGYLSEPFNNFGVANSFHSVFGQFAFFQGAVGAGMSVTFGTNPVILNGSNLVGSHAYTLIAAFVQNGVQYVTLQNPWGIDGYVSTDSNPRDGQVTVPFADVVANCSYADYVTTPAAGLGGGMNAVGATDTQSTTAASVKSSWRVTLSTVKRALNHRRMRNFRAMAVDAKPVGWETA